MKPAIFLFLACTSLTTASAQLEASLWYFGGGAELDFRSGVPVATEEATFYFKEGSSTISDSGGNLLFYTDGRFVYNKMHQLMPNGRYIGGHESSTNSGVIIPRPLHPELFYVFTLYREGGALGYRLVDLSLEGGLGDVSGEGVVLEPAVTEKITAVRHADRESFWAVSHRFPGNEFLAYHVTEAGVNPQPVVSAVGTQIVHGGKGTIGAVKISPDGKKLAVANSAYHEVQLFNFDTATGIVSDPLSLPVPIFGFGPYGIEFSPNSQVLYSSGEKGVVHQYDLSDPAPGSIFNSQTRVSVNEEALGAMQLAIDGKIYVSRQSGKIDVIENPNRIGAACDYKDSAISLGTGYGTLGLPAFIQTYFFTAFSAHNLCLGEGTEFQFNSSEPLLAVEWDFGDGNSSTLESPVHEYAEPGTYSVTLTLTAASETKMETREITIFERAQAHSVPAVEVCGEGGIYEFNLQSLNLSILGSQPASDFGIRYYSKEMEAEKDENALTHMYRNTLPAETLYARVFNLKNPSCYDIAPIELKVQPAPRLEEVSDFEGCSNIWGTTYRYTLSDRTPEVLGGQSEDDFLVHYYRTEEDALGDEFRLPDNYGTQASEERIYFGISSRTHPECRKTGSFLIRGRGHIHVNEPLTYAVCDTDNDGFASFNLGSRIPLIHMGSNEEINVDFYASLEDLGARVNILDKETYVNTQPYEQMIFVRFEFRDYPECYSVDNLPLQVMDSPLPTTVSDWEICEAGDGGQYAFDLSQKDSEILGSGAGDFSVSYHLSSVDAELGEQAISGTFENTSNPQPVFYRIQGSSGASCIRTGSFLLVVYQTPIAHAPAPLVGCDTDESGLAAFNLRELDDEILQAQDGETYLISYFSREADALLNQNALVSEAYNNMDARETLYARLTHREKEDCYDITPLQLILNPLPQPLLEERYVICPDSPELLLDGGDFDSWSWHRAGGDEIGSGQFLSVAELGTYSLKVGQLENGIICEKTISFEVLSSGAPEDFSYELSGVSDRITISIEARGQGTFEYSSDGVLYQDSPVLEVFPGEYTVYVRDKLLCRTLSREIIALGYQKFFTPNGDNTHDFWNVIGLEAYPGALVYIYDRYGKLLSQLSYEDAGWDGTYQGQPVPASDYWFRFEEPRGKWLNGHFSLKR